jgi:hypothetical protein
MDLPLKRVLFAKRHPLQPSHNYSEHMDSLFAPGGGVFVLHVPRDSGHTLLAIRPDGAHPELVFGNNTPYCYGHGREVPDSHEIVCTL